MKDAQAAEFFSNTCKAPQGGEFVLDFISLTFLDFSSS